MPSIFTRLAGGELPCHKIMEDSDYFSFLEISPLKPGHALVIPKKETDYIFDLDDAALSGLVLFAKKAARAIKKAVPCKKVALIVYGLQVPHAHIHLVPVTGDPGELNFSNAKKAADEELALMAEKIRSFTS